MVIGCGAFGWFGGVVWVVVLLLPGEVAVVPGGVWFEDACAVG